MREDNAQQPSDVFLFKRLLAYSLPHKARFIVAFMMLTVAISAEMAIPWLAKIILDEVIVPQQFEWPHLIGLVSLVMLFYVISALFTYLQAVSFRHSALLVINDVRKQLFNHVLNFSISSFDKLSAGKLVSYITNDTESMRDMFVSTIPTIIQGSLRIIAIFIAIAILDWRLMLLSLVLIPILLTTMHLYRKISMPVFNGIREQISNINGRINESLQGMALIQAFNQEKAFKEKFEQENQRWFEFRTKSIAIDSFMLIPLTRLVSNLTAAGIVAWFAYGSLTTVVEVGTLYAFLNYIERFFDPFRQLSMELRKLQVATVASKRVFELLDEQSEQNRYPQEHVEISAPHDIEFRHVDLSYDEGNLVLSDVNFVAKGGQFTAIVGHTGSGKSSVINLLMRFYQQQQGSIFIGGQPIESLPEVQLRKLFGLVSQDPTIFSGSIKDNIDLSHDRPNDEKVMLAAQQVNADHFIKRLTDGYDHHPGYGGGSFSVGERQLLALARALSHDPSVFLLDEATANIDSETEETVKAALENIRDGKTVIMVAHRLSTIKNADQILVMNKGKVVQSGTHDELIVQAGDYRELYLTQKAQEEDEHQNSTLGLASITAA
ncbi:ABC transporter ATP-binding protein [Aliivibrio finisterrensis]|uniref:ABC transporter ATP-binding protein n=1 Tax=Aliivibrio finisterrensis TaxID=511998 RepID=A0A4Q5KJ83_9GAMM|nr:MULTISPECIES: ABC transporter ATP-binding protein [Aliivibrio]MDD9176297.1 ABC transporter ATP-binding protein [Aliivibrio sp. S3TY1]MDD9193324.1 ABC transporter ATP-binding protein [Aliivibrio sp. S2TY2]RYU45536.1 ABC transporter ATP-binding protein [Aliivibrio finisterrensis]